MIAWITAPTGLSIEISCWMPAITRRCWMKERIAPSAASRSWPKNSATRSRSACTRPRSRISCRSWKPASSIATGRSPISRTSFWRTRVQVRPRICSTNQMIPRRSHCSGIWMPACATGPVSQAITPSRRWVRMLFMNWRTPCATALSRLRRKRTGSAMITLKVSRARRKMPTMRAPPAPIAASKMNSASFISAAPREAGEVNQQRAEDADHALQRVDRVQHVLELQCAPRRAEGAGDALPGQVARARLFQEPVVRALECARLHQLVDFLAPARDELGDRAHHVDRGARHRCVGERVAPELHRDQRVAGDLAAEVGERLGEGLFQPGDRLRGEPRDEGGDAPDRRHEHFLRALPYVAWAEDVAPAERVGEAREGVAQALEGDAHRVDLRAHPVGDALRDAVVLEDAEQRLAAGHDAHEAAQHVEPAALHRAHVDRVAADDDA